MHEATKRHPANLLYLAGLFTAILLGMDFAINLWLTDPQHRTAYSDVISPIIDFMASAALFIAAKQSAAHSKRLAVAWGMIGAAALAFAFGDTVWLLLEVGLQEQPFPSLADVFYLAFYPFLLAGVFLLPKKSSTREEQIKKVLDAGIIMVAASSDSGTFWSGHWLSQMPGTHCWSKPSCWLTQSATSCCCGPCFEFFTRIPTTRLKMKHRPFYWLEVS